MKKRKDTASREAETNKATNQAGGPSTLAIPTGPRTTTDVAPVVPKMSSFDYYLNSAVAEQRQSISERPVQRSRDSTPFDWADRRPSRRLESSQRSEPRPETSSRRTSSLAESMKQFQNPAVPSANQPETSEQDQQRLRERFPLPQWANDVRRTERGSKQSRVHGDLIYGLELLRRAIADATKTKDFAQREILFYSKIREHLQKFEYENVTDVIVAKGLALEPLLGLPRLQGHVADGTTFPFDIRADSIQLYRRWSRKSFEGDVMRGILIGANGKAKGKSLDPDYGGRLTCNVFGGGDYLVNGSWHPFWITALRDGAHGAIQAGIHGNPREGAYSIVVGAGENYDDVDEGERLLYCGTKGNAEGATNHTKLLQLNLKNGKPVRVLRSAGASKKSKYAPAVGLRYDGVYKVVDQEVLDKETHHCRFEMIRCPDQDPIRWTGEAIRPNAKDVEIFEMLKQRFN